MRRVFAGPSSCSDWPSRSCRPSMRRRSTGCSPTSVVSTARPTCGVSVATWPGWYARAAAWCSASWVPVVPWEWCWYLIRGQPRTAFRRLRVGGVDWHGLRVRYPSVGTVRRAFRPAFPPAAHRRRGRAASTAVRRGMGDAAHASRDVARPRRAPLGVASRARSARRPLRDRAGASRVRSRMTAYVWGSRRPGGKARGESLPAVFDRRAPP